MISPATSNAVRVPSASADAHALQVPLDLQPVRSDLPWNVAERPPVPGEAKASLELLDALQSDQELGHRVRGVAVVEERRYPAEQVIAGDQHPALGLVQDDVRGRVARCLVDLPGADVGLDLDPRHELAIGGTARAMPVFSPRRSARTARGPPAGRRSDARPRSAGRGRRPGRRRARARAPRRDASTARSRRHPGSGPRGRNGRCGRGCKRAGSRPRSARRPGRARARARGCRPRTRSRCRRARSRPRREWRTRSRAGPRATAAAGAGARSPAPRARRAAVPACAWCPSWRCSRSGNRLAEIRVEWLPIGGQIVPGGGVTRATRYSLVALLTQALGSRGLVWL